MPMNWLHNVPPLYVRSHHVGELQLQRIVAWVEEALFKLFRLGARLTLGGSRAARTNPACDWMVWAVSGSRRS